MIIYISVFISYESYLPQCCKLNRIMLFSGDQRSEIISLDSTPKVNAFPVLLLYKVSHILLLGASSSAAKERSPLGLTDKQLSLKSYNIHRKHFEKPIKQSKFYFYLIFQISFGRTDKLKLKNTTGQSSCVILNNKSLSYGMSAEKNDNIG